jgi:heptosyltransferase-1
VSRLDPSNIRSLLVIKLRAIGDVLLSTAVLPDLRAAFPHAAIDFLTEAPGAGVVEGLPGIRSVIVFRRGDSSTGLISEVRSRGYDLVIDLFGNPRSAVVTLLSGAPATTSSWSRGAERSTTSNSTSTPSARGASG